VSTRKGLDASSKLGRAIWRLVDSTMKMNGEVRTRVMRIKNLVDAAPDDQMTRYKINPDLMILMRDPKLNAQVLAIQRAMPK
jgi:hypothetical protein